MAKAQKKAAPAAIDEFVPVAAAPTPVTVKKVETFGVASIQFTLSDGVVVDAIVAGKGSNAANMAARGPLLEALSRTVAAARATK